MRERRGGKVKYGNAHTRICEGVERGARGRQREGVRNGRENKEKGRLEGGKGWADDGGRINGSPW